MFVYVLNTSYNLDQNVKTDTKNIIYKKHIFVIQK